MSNALAISSKTVTVFSSLLVVFVRLWINLNRYDVVACCGRKANCCNLIFPRMSKFSLFTSIISCTFAKVLIREIGLGSLGDL